MAVVGRATSREKTCLFLVHCYKRNVTLLEMFGQEKYHL